MASNTAYAANENNSTAKSSVVTDHKMLENNANETNILEEPSTPMTITTNNQAMSNRDRQSNSRLQEQINELKLQLKTIIENQITMQEQLRSTIVTFQTQFTQNMNGITGMQDNQQVVENQPENNQPQEEEATAEVPQTQNGESETENNQQLNQDSENEEDFPESDNDSGSIYEPSLNSQSQSQSQSVIEVAKPKISKAHWKLACQQLLNFIWDDKDSKPFRAPIDEVDYPDYRKIVQTPMDLFTIKEDLDTIDNYKSPVKFADDMKLMFKNSRDYNNPRSKIYKQTVRLSKIFEERMAPILAAYKTGKQRKSSANSTPKKASPSKRDRSESYDFEDSDDAAPLKRRRRILNSEEAGSSGVCQKRLTKRGIQRIEDSETSEIGGISNGQVDISRRTRLRALADSKRSDETSEYIPDDDIARLADVDDISTIVTQNDDEYSEIYSSIVGGTDYEEEDDDYSEEEDVEKESLSQTPLAERLPKIANSSRQRETKSRSIAFTPSDFLLNCIKPGQQCVSITGKVSRVFKKTRVFSKEREMWFDLFKFIIGNDGINVQCIAWEEIASALVGKVKRHHVIRLDGVIAKKPIPQFNFGNVDYVLVLHNYTKVVHL